MGPFTPLFQRGVNPPFDKGRLGGIIRFRSASQRHGMPAYVPQAPDLNPPILTFPRKGGREAYFGSFFRKGGRDISFGFLPPCGGGFRWGVYVLGEGFTLSRGMGGDKPRPYIPPSYPSPTRGEGISSQ